MGKVRLILVGGFLGAGKTTLIARAASHFIKQNKRVGIITNDQAVNLVDTNLLQQHGFSVQEVAGGCFCCRFSDFIAAAERVISENKPDVILGEPVGSCTDLSATVLQPLKKLHSDKFELSPFSVLVDPIRLLESLKAPSGSLLPECALYIYRKQLEEADLIVLNKADIISAKQAAEVIELLNREFPEIPISTISALKGDSVERWLDFVMSGKNTSGQRITEVDYDTYAEGEAVLGWLNASFQLHSKMPIDWKNFCHSYLGSMQGELKSRQAEIAHLKLFIKGAGGFLVASLVSNSGPIFVAGNLKDSSQDVNLVVNARVRIEPNDLQSIVEKSLEVVAGDKIKVTTNSIESFKPGRPKPTHHFNSVQ
jgi:G3E family GTPase